MAGGGALMDCDLEDGEISGFSSDTEMGPATAAQQARPQVAPASCGQSFQNRACAQTLPAAAYRSTGRTAESSDSDPESSDEEAAGWRWKCQKVSSAPQPPACSARRGPTPVPAQGMTGGRKVNNIWGSVVQEQCQDAVTAELGMSSRNVETYNFVLARKIMEKEWEVEAQSKEGGEVSMLDDELEEYMEYTEYMEGRGSEENTGDDAKRKRPAKERLGPRAEMDIKGRYDITEGDPDDKVIEEIAFRLQEPKKELITRVVKVVGKKKAIELLGETGTLEESGGVYTMDGSRRRTPGGVYLNLLKNTPSITKAQIKQIFFEEYKSKKAARFQQKKWKK